MLVEIRNVFVSIVLSLFLFNSHAVTGRFGFEIGLPFGFFINGNVETTTQFFSGARSEIVSQSIAFALEELSSKIE